MIDEYSIPESNIEDKYDDDFDNDFSNSKNSADVDLGHQPNR